MKQRRSNTLDAQERSADFIKITHKMIVRQVIDESIGSYLLIRSFDLIVATVVAAWAILYYVVWSRIMPGQRAAMHVYSS